MTRFASLSLVQLMALVAAAHALIWAVVPVRFIGNLHYDTLELVYWGRDWMLGYGKHPPLGTFIIDLFTHLTPFPVFNLLALSQICVVLSCFFIWKTARLFIPAQGAIAAVAVFLLSPEANVYSVQVNHNTLLMPLWAASLYVSLRYLGAPSWRNAALAGFVAGLAMLTKYQIVIQFTALVALALVEPRYRSALWRLPTLLAAGVALLILMPHLAWLVQNHWSTVSYAVDSRDVESWRDFFDALNNSLIGPLVLLIGPGLVFALARLAGFHFSSEDGNRRVALMIGAGPVVVMWLAAILTRQDPKQSWFLVFMPNVAVGFALAWQWSSRTAGRFLHDRLLPLMPLIALGQVFVLLSYIFFNSVTARPMLIYDLDGGALASEVEEMWRGYQSTPLRCVIINDTKIGGSSVLWLKQRAKFVDFASPYWSTPERISECAQSGGVAIINRKHGSQLLQAAFPGLCHNTLDAVEIPTVMGGMRNSVPVDVIYLPPAGEAGPGACARMRDEQNLDKDL